MLDRQEVQSHHRKPEGKPADAEAGQNEAQEIERVAKLGAHVGNKARCRDDADEPDRHVDQKNPMP